MDKHIPNEKELEVVRATPCCYALGKRITRERERKHPGPTGSPMGMPIRWEPGNRGETPDRAVGSPGHLGHLTKVSAKYSRDEC